MLLLSMDIYLKPTAAEQTPHLAQSSELLLLTL